MSSPDQEPESPQGLPDEQTLPDTQASPAAPASPDAQSDPASPSSASEEPAVAQYFEGYLSSLEDQALRRQTIHRQTGLSRLLLVGWCLWLLGVWMVSLWLYGGRQESVRWMIHCLFMGTALLWPVARLTMFYIPGRQDRVGQRRYQSGGLAGSMLLLDALSLTLVTQIVIWPLWMTVGWPLLHALLIALMLAGWTLLVAAILMAVCRSSREWSRSLGVGILALLILGEPLLQGFLAWIMGAGAGQSGVNWPWVISPLGLLNTLAAADASTGVLIHALTHAFGIALAGLGGWCWLLLQSKKIRLAGPNRAELAGQP